MTRIGILGQFGCGNSGNDGSLEVMLNFLRRALPKAELTCICSNPDKVHEAHHIPTISIHDAPVMPKAGGSGASRLGVPRRLRTWVHALRQARRCDLLVVPGTGILDDFQERPTGWPYALFRWCVAARLCGTRIAFISIGAGPVEHPVSRWLLKTAASMARYRSYRDEASKEFMQSIGLNCRHDPVYPDLVFALPMPPHDRSSPGDRELTVGVGVMAYCGWRKDDDRGASIYHNYLQKLVWFVGWLLDRGYRVRLLTGDASDWLAVTEVVRRLAAARGSKDARLIAEPASSLHELMRQLTDTSIVVVTRYHNLVCALKLGKPTISVGYSMKNDVLLAQIGLDEFCQPIANLDVNILATQFLEVVRKRNYFAEKTKEANIRFARQLRDQEEILLDKLFGVHSAAAAGAGEMPADQPRAALDEPQTFALDRLPR